MNYALQDNRIQTVILKLDNFAYGGFSKLERIGAVLDNITQNGKEVIAYSEFYNRSSYYLAARSSRVLLHPQGVVLPQGFSFYSNYFKDLIDKVKIEFNIFRVGSYKSAVEPFVRNDMSDETKQSRLRVSEKLWKKYENDVLKSRGLPSEALSKFSEDLSDITKIANSSIASIALSNKVVDELIEYAIGYARPLYDRELHDQLLNEVISSDPLKENYTLINVLAIKQAQNLIETADDYF